MENIDFITKELVASYNYDNIDNDRSIQGEYDLFRNSININVEFPAIAFVGNVYKIFDKQLKRYKYLLLVGNSTTFDNIDESQLYEEANINANISPMCSLIIEDFIKYDHFRMICDIYIKSTDKLVKTDVKIS